VQNDAGGVDRGRKAWGGPPSQQGLYAGDERLDPDPAFRRAPFQEPRPGVFHHLPGAGDHERPWIRGERPVRLEPLEQALHRG